MQYKNNGQLHAIESLVRQQAQSTNACAEFERQLAAVTKERDELRDIATKNTIAFLTLGLLRVWLRDATVTAVQREELNEILGGE